MPSKKLIIIKCQAHRKYGLNITKGNSTADEAAKKAANSTQAVLLIKYQDFWSPYLQAHVDRILGECEVCAQYNTRIGITTLLGQVPLQEGLFKHLTFDYVDMIMT